MAAAACVVVSLALFLFSAITTARAAHEGGLPPVITSNVSSRCVPPTPDDILLTCTVDANDTVSNDVHWIIGDYQVVDPLEFRDYGVVVTPTTTNTPLTTTMELIVPRDSTKPRSAHGTTFLFNNSVNPAFPEARDNPVNISCVSIQNNLNVIRADPIILYSVAPPVEDPVVNVTNCSDTGTLSLSITYQRINDSEICSRDPPVYNLSLSSGQTFNFTDDTGDLVAVFDDVVVTSDLTAIMTVCVGDNCSDTYTPLTGVTCNASHIDICREDPSQGLEEGKQAVLECDLTGPPSDRWSCQYVSAVTVADVFDGDVYGQSSVLDMSRSGDTNCTVIIPDIPDEEQCDEGLVIGLSVIIGLVAGFTLVFFPLIFIGQCRKHEIWCFNKS